MNQLTTVADTRADLELARAFSEAKMVPDHYRKSPGDCYIAIKLAQRFHMDPWSVMQEMYIIQGKPMMSGKLATAILNNSLAEPLRPTYAGEGDERTITLTGKPEGEPAPLSVTLKVKDAKTNNDQWKRNPDQMLMYAGSRMWGRRYCPDILLGIVFDDEEISASPAQLASEKPRTPIASPPPQARADVIDEKTGEVLDTPVPLPKNPDESWYSWGKRFVACARGAPDIDTVDQWLAANSETLALCQKESEKIAGNIEAAVKQLKLSILDQGEGT
jgi:hypothetical protein